MIITPLWHTEFLVDITNKMGKNIRILVDAWLSDFVVGDMMERAVKVQLDREKIKTIDIIYISHSHTDHFDPYTLIEIYNSCPSDERRICPDSPENTSKSFMPQDDKNKKPLLLLPSTLSFLVPLIREYLWDIRIEVLMPRHVFCYEGIDISGHMFPQNTITNEDDVMMISIDNGHELLFAEIDTLPEEDDLDTQKELYRILTKKDYDTVCYLASRNELPGQLPILDLPPKRRKTFRDDYIAGRKDEMYFSYQKYEYEDFENFPNIYGIPNLVRGFIWQGIVYPREFSLDYARVQIFPLEEIASMESDIARECGYEFPQKALLPRRQYRVEFATIEAWRKECQIGELIVDREHGNLESSDSRIYASAPLFVREVWDIENEKKRVLDILNTRFLPYWSASPIASLRSALIQNPDGCYRIGFKIQNDASTIFEYSVALSWFTEVSYVSDMQIDEEYWLLDVLDFLDGRQELYSNFWHKLDPKKIYRLWTCLGANFCNNDMLLSKYRFHFERAQRWETSESFFEEVKKGLVL